MIGRMVCMAGRIKYMIDTLIEKRAHGNPTIVNTTRVKLRFKGISPDLYTRLSEDDPVIIEKLNDLAKEWGIIL
jgi:hypothetical protein